MILPKKGSRRISVDGLEYRWYIRRKPTYGQAIHGGMTIAIQFNSETKGAVLLIELKRGRPDSWLKPDYTPITPKNIEQYIRTALEKGWQADRLGSPFILRHTDF